MSINLVKGQKIDLAKPDGGELRNIMVGLGWDPVRQRGLFGANIDCDASVMLLQNGRFADLRDIVAFFNLKHKSKSVIHSGDNLTGAGDGDDEEIMIRLQDVPPEYDRLVVAINIYQCKKRRQNWGMIRNAFVRIVDMDTGQELMRYDLSGGNYDGMTAMIVGEVYRHNGGWKFSAIGEGTTDGSIKELAARYS